MQKKTSLDEKGSIGRIEHNANIIEEMDDSDWEDGFMPISSSVNNTPSDSSKGLTIEFDAPQDSATRKRHRRVSAKDKELAELVHKAHLLCLIARGRLIDMACDDPLIKASLLSLLPTNLLNISNVSKLTANDLVPLVRWFHSNFRTRIPRDEERSFHSALAVALGTYDGTPEEITALSVALFRALNLTARFVCILDVSSSLKPDTEKSESLAQDASRSGTGVFNSSTLMVTTPNKASMSKFENIDQNSKEAAQETKFRRSTRNNTRRTRSPSADKSYKTILDAKTCEEQKNTSESMHINKPENLKRKGDVEFQMQLEMAVAATSACVSENNISSDVKELQSNSSKVSSPFKRVKGIQSELISTAIGSRKVGAPLYWAEVYCSGENVSGKWVHCDAVNAIIDGATKVEAEAAACKILLKYVVAFAGGGAKDVTRRYCMKWYKIASQRINSVWWDSVLAPLKEMESGATGDRINLKKEQYSSSCDHDEVEARRISEARNSLEDMELQTRALTEPLPTNQQAYKNHQLYAIERWLTKNQILHPKGPILGFCSGHAVYPRDCVQTLKTKERWLREALQVKANELPVKVLKSPRKVNKIQISEDYNCVDPVGEENVSLYGKWQLEPLCLPRAVNGIVPKNERGQVDVWSEKCLPPGTVHIRLPRVVPVARKLAINFAPAMVGFEFRNGRSLPVFEGIVVCTEFKDAILQAYAEEEEKRVAEEKKRNKREAVARWYQLLSSIVTRQRLNNSYGDVSLSQTHSNKDNSNSIFHENVVGKKDLPRESPKENSCKTRLNFSSMALEEENHEHVFSTKDQSFDEENSILTKRCSCGFIVQVEEM